MSAHAFPRAASRPVRLLLMVALAASAGARELDRSEVWIATGLSLSVPGAAIALGFVPVVAPGTSGLIPWITNPLLALEHVPLYAFDWRLALGYSALSVALPAAGLGVGALGGGNGFANEVAGAFLAAYSNVSRFSSYAVYREARSRADAEPAYRDGLSALRFFQVVAAGLDPRLLVEPLVFVPALIGGAAIVGFNLLAVRDGSGSPLVTGKAYVGPTEANPLLAAAFVAGVFFVDAALIAVGEEALHRGVLYEELAEGGRIGLARAVDCVLFPAVHLPFDLRTGLPPGAVFFNFAYRAAMTLVFDMAYDRGGLPLAVASHLWSDYLLLLARWVAYGGEAP